MLINLILTFSAAAFIMITLFNFTHMFQQEGYKRKEYMGWLAEYSGGRIIFILLVSVLYFIMSSLLVNSHIKILSLIGWILYAVFAGLSVFYYFRFRVRDAKLPLKFTWRVKRLFITSVLVLVILAVLCSFAGPSLMGIVIVFAPLFILCTDIINSPVEKHIRNGFLKDARKRLDARKDLIKIGITGSYGKTSTKFILGTILSEKYDPLVPPSSYNTPMGVTRVIREQLSDNNDVFIAEMGAKNIGDIKELVDLVHPKFGIITSVGPQHLESFHTIENVARTKYELIEGLPEDGTAFFPDDHAYTKELYDMTEHVEKVLFGIEEDEYEKGTLDVYARNIRSTENGSEFELVCREGSIDIVTKLLGKHNVMNIVGCAAIALKLGLSLEQIRDGAAKIESIEHRLQLIRNGNGITVIDDAFNSNPVGSKAAIDVLSSFTGRKIVVTPGMIELGESEDQENFNFGSYMADKVDFVYLVGPNHTKPIYEGLTENGFDADKIRVVKSLNEASQDMGTLLVPGDVILFENDLPDNYNEE